MREEVLLFKNSGRGEGGREEKNTVESPRNVEKGVGK